MSQANPRVFITQESSTLNYGHAEEFGKIVFVTCKEVSPVPGSLMNGELCDEVKTKLADFDFDYDYLVPSGSPVVSGIAFMELGRLAAYRDVVDGSRAPKQLRVLRWSNRDRVYQPITIYL